MNFIIKANAGFEIGKFCESLQYILMEVSRGGHESLIIPRCADMPDADYLINYPETRFTSMN